MNDFIRPRRGTKTTMHETEKAVTILKEGEIFVEATDDGVGKAPSKVKIGDGVSAYVALPYAIGNELEERPVDFLEDHRDSFDAVYGDFKTGATVFTLASIAKRCIYILKQLLDNIDTRLTNNYYQKSEVYNKTEVYNKNEVYTIQEADERFYDKDAVFTKTESDDRYYTKTEVYTKAEIDEFLENIYWKSEVYNKTETEEKIRIPVVSTDPSSPEIGDHWVKI